MKFVVAIFAVAAVVAVAAALDVRDPHYEAFADFVERYGKTAEYPAKTDAEVSHRFEEFKANVARAEKMNQVEGNKVFGVTKFSDLTEEEFRARYLMPNVPRLSEARLGDEVDIRAAAARNNADALPTNFDWRQHNNPEVIGPVRNQGECGSCWAFSTAEAVASAWAMANNSFVMLSPQNLVDCVSEYDGCGGGDTTGSYEWIIKNGGLDTEASYPYQAVNGQCKFKKSDIGASIKTWKYATQDKNEDQMMSALYANGPLSICADAASWQLYSSGIIRHFCGQSLDHCIMISGWGTEKYGILKEDVEYWWIRNSWGSSWGQDGYLQVERNHNLCGVADEATYAIA